MRSMNILIVDDEETNLKLLGFYIKTYFADNNGSEYTLDMATNGLEALGYCAIRSYDVMFLDVKMPKLDGIKLLNVFKVNRVIHKPFICMVTALGEDKYRHLFTLLGAEALIVKPFTKGKIHEILGRFYIPSSLESFEEFDEFDEFDEVDEAGGATEEKSAGVWAKVSAVDFLGEYANIEYMLEDLEDIDDVLREIIDQLDIANFRRHQEDIELALIKYGRFLNSLLCFSELSNALRILNDHILSIDLDRYDELKSSYLIELVRAILEDISTWKENVFVKQNANDVYYINDSVLSNCAQLKKSIGS